MLLLFVTACQASPTAVEETHRPTGAAQTASPAQQDMPATFTPVPSPTRLPQGAAGIDPASLEGESVLFWHPWMEEMASKAEDLASEFNRTNTWGIRVEVQAFASNGELYDALTTAVAEDEALPDLVAATSEQIAEWDAADGVVAPLDDLLLSPAVGLTEAERAAYFPIFWEQDRHQDRQLAIPLLRNAQILFYNATWAADLGFAQPPATPEQFEQQACAAAVENNMANQGDKAGTGGWMIDTDALTLASWIGAFGGSVTNADTSRYEFQTNAGEDAVAYLRGLMDQGCAWLPRAQEPHEVFARRLAIFVTGSLPDIAYQQRVSKIVGGGDRWVVLPFPTVQGQPQAWSSGYSMAVLRAAGEEQASHRQQLAAWLFLRWLSGADQSVQLVQIQPSLAVSTALEQKLASVSTYPHELIEPVQAAAYPAPSSASWRLARRLVSDAAWQIFYLPTDQTENVLPELDDSISEMIDSDTP